MINEHLSNQMTRLRLEIKGHPVITRGFEFGHHIIYFPVHSSDFANWLLMHRSTSSQLARFSYDDFRTGYAIGLVIQGWDWRGSQIEAVPVATHQKWGELYRNLELDKSPSGLMSDRVKMRREKNHRQLRLTNR